jgi:GxxExxY protein
MRRGSPRRHGEHGVLKHEEVTNQLIGAAIEVHKCLGPGLLESAYEACMCHELTLRNVRFACQVPLPIVYKSVAIDCVYRIDLIVEEAVVVELKSVEAITKLHEAQLLTYMRLRNILVGLLINFNVVVLKEGIVRRVL